jgi:trk system potassium uptake protein TrkA
VASKKDFAVIGLGTFGLAIARGLAQRGNAVLGIDINKSIIEAHTDEFESLVRADTTKIETLEELDIASYNAVVVGIGNTEANILTVQLLRELKAKFILARARSETHEHILFKLGADSVVNPEKNMGDRVSMMLTGGLIVEIVDLAEDFSVAGIKVGDKFSGMTLKEIEFRKKFGVNAIMVRREGVSYPLNSPDDKIFKNDIVFVAGQHAELEKIDEI